MSIPGEIWIIVFFIAYFVVMRYVLPKAGVNT